MLGVPRWALIDKKSRGVLFGCSQLACLSLRKVNAIDRGMNGLLNAAARNQFYQLFYTYFHFSMYGYAFLAPA